MLGILTISSHSSLRNYIRKSWINDLPENVCYIFLYDKREDIPENEKFDGIPLKAKHKGWAVRFGEKLYRYYKYVNYTQQFKDVKYVVKMDDDAILCPKKFFNYLSDKNLTTKSNVGWFHNMETWKSKVDEEHRSDEMFVLLGRDLVNRIVSREYCWSEERKDCDSLNQRYDTNYGGTSLGIWLSEMNDINPLPMNDVFDHMNSNDKLKPKDAILFHTAKTPEIAKEKYSYCISSSITLSSKIQQLTIIQIFFMLLPRMIEMNIFIS